MSKDTGVSARSNRFRADTGESRSRLPDDEARGDLGGCPSGASRLWRTAGIPLAKPRKSAYANSHGTHRDACRRIRVAGMAQAGDAPAADGVRHADRLRDLVGASEQFRRRSCGIHRRRDRLVAHRARNPGFLRHRRHRHHRFRARTDPRHRLSVPAWRGQRGDRVVSEFRRAAGDHDAQLDRVPLLRDGEPVASVAVAGKEESAADARLDRGRGLGRVPAGLRPAGRDLEGFRSRLRVRLSRLGGSHGGDRRLLHDRLSAVRGARPADQAHGASEALLATTLCSSCPARAGRFSSCSRPS